MKLGLTTVAAGLLLATAPLAHHGDLELTNATGIQLNLFEGHDLTPVLADGVGGGPRILYAPSEADDAAYRGTIAAAAGGGATVDYFDARNDTPSVALMTTYDCVYTWTNFAYANNVLFGDNLAAASDAGVDVVLGAFCTFTTGNFLSGGIMGPAYCPVVSPTGTNHFTPSSYIGDGGSCLYVGVDTSLNCNFRDVLVTQGNGVVDGTYQDGEICGAIRPNPGGGAGDVIYNNGSGALQLGCGGPWGAFAANGCVCDAGSGSFGTCTFRNGGGTNPTGFVCNNAPTVSGGVWNSTVPVEGVPGAVSTIVIIANGGPSSGSFIFGSEVLVAGDVIIDTAAAVSHSIAVPPGAAGMAVSTQGGVVTASTVVLRNAQDLTVGS